MRFFTAVSIAFAAITGVVSAQSATGTGTASAPVATEGGMNSNAITSPVGTDSITAGEEYTIEWTNIAGETVTLVLVDGPENQLEPVATIVASVDNTGSYTWSVPDDLLASDSYAIQISYDDDPENWNYSDRFVFNSDVTATPSVTTAASTTTEESSTSTEESSTESETSTTESETSTITSAATTTTESTSTIRTSTSRRSTTSSEATSTGAPDSAANSNIVSPVAMIMAVFAAAAFIH